MSETKPQDSNVKAPQPVEPVVPPAPTQVATHIEKPVEPPVEKMNYGTGTTAASVYTVGFGSQLAYATITSGTVGTYTVFAQTLDLNSPAPEVGDIKITNNSSPNNSHEYAPGLIEPSDLEFECIFEKSPYETVYNLLGNNQIYSFQETFPADSAGGASPTCTFPGYWKSIGVEGKTEDQAIKGKLKIKCTTKPVWA